MNEMPSPDLGLAGGPEPDVLNTLVLPGRPAFIDLRSRVDFRHWPETAFEEMTMPPPSPGCVLPPTRRRERANRYRSTGILVPGESACDNSA